MDLSKLSDQELEAIAMGGTNPGMGLSSYEPSSPRTGFVAAPMQIKPVVNDLQDSMGNPLMIADMQPQEPDISSISDEELMALAGVKSQPPVQEQMQASKQNIQQDFDRRKAGLFDRIADDWRQNTEGPSMQETARQQLAGQISPAEANIRAGLKTAKIVPDIAGELFTSAFRTLPDIVENPIREGASNVYSSLAASPVGDLAGSAAKAYEGFAERNPVAASRLGSIADAGNLVAGFVPIKGTNAVRTLEEAASPVVKTGTQIATQGAKKAYSATALAPEQKLLQDAGVRLTSGQRSGGIVKAIENKATSIPVVGDAITASYRRGIEDFNRVVADDVLSSINAKLPKSVATGRDTVSFAYDQIGKSYDEALSKMTGTIDKTFSSDWNDAIARAKAELPTDKAQQVERKINNAINLRLSGQVIKSGDNKQIMRRLKTDAAKYSKSLDPDQQLMGEIFQDLHSAYSEMLQRNNPADLSKKLKDTDLAFAKYVRLEQAAASSKDGIFSPAALVGAVKKTDGSVRKGAFARGDALMQDLAQAGNNVLPNNIPDSGTAGRLGLGLLGAGGLSAVSPAAIPALAVGALAAGAYTRPGQAAIREVSKLVRKK